MGKELYELREMLMDELHKISSKGELTAGSLETVDKLTHSIKSIDTICAMEEAGEYSYESGNNSSYAYDGMSYRGGNSYARGRGTNARRDSMGRYSSERGYSRRRGYSGDDKQELVESLRELMQETTDSKSRMAIQRAIEQMEE